MSPTQLALISGTSTPSGTNNPNSPGSPHSGSPTPSPSPSSTSSSSPSPSPSPTYSEAVHVFSGYGGARGYSLDLGRTWHATDDEAAGADDCWNYRGMTYGAGKWVAVGWAAQYGRVSTTPDGVHWRHYETTTYAPNTVTYGNGMFVSDVFTSTDGYTFNWRNISTTVTGHPTLNSIGNNFVVTGDSHGIGYSTDGTNFTTTLADYTGAGYNSTIFQWAKGNGILVGIAAQRIATSSNEGVTWTNQDPALNSDDTINAIIFDGSEFIIYGNNIWKSSDGIHWTETVVSTHPPYQISGLAGQGFFGLGGDWTVGTNWHWSTDGVNWNNSTSIVETPTVNINDGFWGLNNFISGVPSSNPNNTPTLPASVLLSNSQLPSFCQTAYGR